MAAAGPAGRRAAGDPPPAGAAVAAAHPRQDLRRAARLPAAAGDHARRRRRPPVGPAPGLVRHRLRRRPHGPAGGDRPHPRDGRCRRAPAVAVRHRGRQALRRRPARQPHHADRGADRHRLRRRHAQDLVARDHLAGRHRRRDGDAGAGGAGPARHAPGGGAPRRLHRLGRRRAAEPGRRRADPGRAAAGPGRHGAAGGLGAVQEGRGRLAPGADRHPRRPDRQGAHAGRRRAVVGGAGGRGRGDRPARCACCRPTACSRSAAASARRWRRTTCWPCCRRHAQAPADLRERALVLAGALLEMAGRAAAGEGLALARQTLDSGQAWRQFAAICEAQGGLREPGRAPHVRAIPAAARRHRAGHRQPPHRDGGQAGRRARSTRSPASRSKSGWASAWSAASRCSCCMRAARASWTTPPTTCMRSRGSSPSEKAHEPRRPAGARRRVRGRAVRHPPAAVLERRRARGPGRVPPLSRRRELPAPARQRGRRARLGDRLPARSRPASARPAVFGRHGARTRRRQRRPGRALPALHAAGHPLPPRRGRDLAHLRAHRLRRPSTGW